MSIDTGVVLKNFRKLVDTFKGGKISSPEHVLEWEKLTSDQEILKIVRGDDIDFGSDPPEKQQARPCLVSKENEILMGEEIENMLQKGIIQECYHEAGEYVSPIFPVFKTDGRLRIILNLKQLNDHIKKLHFKMDNIQTVLRCVTKGCYMAAIDLKHAYYSVKVADEFQKYLKFMWDESLYKFTCFPNGLGPCPRKFTKLMKVPLSHLREMRHIIVGYIDDFFMKGTSKERCFETLLAAATLLQKLGFTIHPEKSDLEPATRIIFLGFIIDSIAMNVTLPEDKKAKILDLIDQVLSKDTVPIRLVASLIGNFVSSFPASLYGPLYYRVTEREKNIALSKSKKGYDGTMWLSQIAKDEVLWWKENIPTMTGPVQWPPITEELSADAAGKNGWGAMYKGSRIGGTWDEEQKGLHINVKEMLAVFYALRSFAEDLKGKHVRVLSDNRTTVSAVNKMGSTRSQQCNVMSQCIWEFCREHDMFVTCTYIPGKENIEADRESRREYKQGEWMLDASIFKTAIQHFKFQANIDCFATRVNTQLKCYASRKPDPYASHIDAFSFNWSLFKPYVFPPFSVISRVLQKLRIDQVTALCVLPKWPTQAWWPLAQEMMIGEPLIIAPHPGNLVLPGKDEIHPLHKKLRLCICLLSGESMNKKD